MPRVMFASFPLRLVMPKDRLAAAAQGVTKLVFRTLPSVNKLEIKEMLTKLYSLPVASVDTSNVEGKKKRSRGGFFRKADYKNAYVTLSSPVVIPAPPPVEKKGADGKAADGKKG